MLKRKMYKVDINGHPRAYAEIQNVPDLETSSISRATLISATIDDDLYAPAFDADIPVAVTTNNGKLTLWLDAPMNIMTASKLSNLLYKFGFSPKPGTGIKLRKRFRQEAYLKAKNQSINFFELKHTMLSLVDNYHASFDELLKTSQELTQQTLYDGPKMLNPWPFSISSQAVVLPSSTKNHNHIYLNETLKWKEYLSLLKALAAANVIEPGYLKVSKMDHTTNLRRPGYEKPEDGYDSRLEVPKGSPEPAF